MSNPLSMNGLDCATKYTSEPGPLPSEQSIFLTRSERKPFKRIIRNQKDNLLSHIYKLLLQYNTETEKKVMTCTGKWMQNFDEEISFQEWENLWTKDIKSRLHTSPHISRASREPPGRHGYTSPTWIQPPLAAPPQQFGWGTPFPSLCYRCSKPAGEQNGGV